MRKKEGILPGIIGVVPHRANTQHEHLSSGIDAMMRPLLRQPGHICQQEFTPTAAFASVRIDGEPRIAVQRGQILAYHGEIVAQDSLLTRPIRDLLGGDFSGCSFADVLLALYQTAGPRAVCGLNGLYTLLIWDEAARKLTLINDRYGIQKLYTWSSTDLFLVASECKAIAAHPAFHSPVSPLAVTDLISVGHMLDDRTLFRDVKLLPPASILTYQDGKLNLESYWDYPFGRFNGHLHHEKHYIDGMAAAAQQAVSRRAQPNACLLLTGGLDSRLVAGLYRRAAPDQTIHAAALGQEQSSDVRYGRQIANRLNFDFSFLPIQPSYLADYTEECVRMTEGNMNVYAGWILLANPFFQRSGIRYALTGIGGELAAGRHFLLETYECNTERALQMLYDREDYRKTTLLLRKNLAQDLVRESFSTFRQTLQRANFDHPLNQLDFLSLYQSMRRHATSVDVFADTVHPLDPLLDNDLIDFVLQIPPELRARGYLYKKMIQSQLPDLANIGEALKGPVLKAAVEVKIQPITSLYRRAARRLRMFTPQQSLHPGDNPNNYIHPNTWLRTANRDFAQQTLAQEEYLDDLFDMDEVRRLAKEHMEGKRNEYKVLCALLTYITWRKLFT